MKIAKKYARLYEKKNTDSFSVFMEETWNNNNVGIY